MPAKCNTTYIYNLERCHLNKLHNNDDIKIYQYFMPAKCNITRIYNLERCHSPI